MSKVKIEDQYTIIVKDQRIKLNRDELNELRDELDRVLGQKQYINWPNTWPSTPAPMTDPFKFQTWSGDDPNQFVTWGTNGPVTCCQQPIMSGVKPNHNPDNDGTSVR